MKPWMLFSTSVFLSKGFDVSAGMISRIDESSANMRACIASVFSLFRTPSKAILSQSLICAA